MRTLASSILIACCFMLAACGPKERDAHTLAVGVIAGPEAELMTVAKTEAKKSGLTLQIITFNDYATPNLALVDGSIDANMFQHLPYLQTNLKIHADWPLVPVGKTFIYPMGLYSKKVPDVLHLSEGASIAIPNDPTNGERALLLLQQAGLIVLSKTHLFTTPLEGIRANPHHFRIIELDAAQLARSLDDVALAAINTNYAVPAGLNPKQDALVLEHTDSPYANIVVTTRNKEKDPRIAKLLEALHSDAVVAASKQLFHGNAIPAWTHEHSS